MSDKNECGPVRAGEEIDRIIELFEAWQITKDNALVKFMFKRAVGAINALSAQQAAAPEMYEALKELVAAELEHDTSYDQDRVFTEDRLIRAREQARGALKKARGEE